MASHILAPFAKGDRMAIFLSAFSGLIVIVLGGFMALDQPWAQRWKNEIGVAITVVALIGFAASMVVGLDSNRVSSSLAASIVELTRVQNLNTGLQETLLDSSKTIAESSEQIVKLATRNNDLQNKNLELQKQRYIKEEKLRADIQAKEDQKRQTFIVPLIQFIATGEDSLRLLGVWSDGESISRIHLPRIYEWFRETLLFLEQHCSQAVARNFRAPSEAPQKAEFPLEDLGSYQEVSRFYQLRLPQLRVLLSDGNVRCDH